MVLAAAACTNRGGTQPPTTSIRTTGVSEATPHGSSAAPPARNLRGLIAYSTQAGDIWVMHADGSNRRQVTKPRDPAYDFDPSLSPDGRRVVFRTSRGRYVPDPNGTGVQGIFVIDLNGSHERQIQPPRGGLFPDWSPDGRRIAFSTVRADGTETIVTPIPTAPMSTTPGSSGVSARNGRRTGPGSPTATIPATATSTSGSWTPMAATSGN
jgi:dipeptidyl aminopeptidase/acylaminoacyl peptidase